MHTRHNLPVTAHNHSFTPVLSAKTQSRSTFAVITASLVCALCLQSAIPALADWRDTKSHPILDDCVNSTIGRTLDSTASGELDDPLWGGDSLASYRQEVACKIYDKFTKDFGCSGAFACGVLANIKGESGFIEDAGEWNGHGKPDVGGVVRFGMDSATPPANFYSADSGGGGGLFQFTPYTVFTQSKYWHLINPLQGWAAENQVQFVWDTDFCSGALQPYFNAPRAGVNLYRKSFPDSRPLPQNIMQLCSISEPDIAARMFQACCERPARYHPEREQYAKEFAEYFRIRDGSLPSADLVKLEDQLHGLGSITGQTGELYARPECDPEPPSISGDLANVAKQICDDNSIGYSQANRTLNPGVDCSSFVFYVLLKSHTVTPEQFGCDENSPYNVAAFRANASKIGYKIMPWNGDGSQLQPGDLLLRGNAHIEICIAIENGQPIVAGAHWDKDGRPGDSSGHEVDYKPYAGGHWTDLMRKI